MRKISNNNKNMLVGPRIPKVVEKRQDIRVSLGEIQKLSYEIDRQFRINDKSRFKNKILQESVGRQQAIVVGEHEGVGYERQEEQEQQEQTVVFSQLTHIQKAVELSLQQYYEGLSQMQSEFDSKEENDSNEQYGAYRKLLGFNRDLREIIENIYSLRRLQLVLNNGTNQPINCESDILRMIRSYLIHNSSANHQQQQTTLLSAINKLQTIQKSIQNKIQRLLDDVGYKRRVIEQLGKSRQRVEDDVEIVTGRNGKLRKQLNLKGQQQQEDIIGRSSSQEEGQQQHDYHQGNTCQQNLTSQQQNPQHQYLSLMAHYQLYNPQKQQFITSQFPKNKTQAFMLLNQLDQQISQLELNNTLKLYSN